MNLARRFCPNCSNDTLFVGRACNECGWVVPPMVTHFKPFNPSDSQTKDHSKQRKGGLRTQRGRQRA